MTDLGAHFEKVFHIGEGKTKQTSHHSNPASQRVGPTKHTVSTTSLGISGKAKGKEIHQEGDYGTE